MSNPSDIKYPFYNAGDQRNDYIECYYTEKNENTIANSSKQHMRFTPFIFERRVSFNVINLPIFRDAAWNIANPELQVQFFVYNSGSDGFPQNKIATSETAIAPANDFPNVNEKQQNFNALITNKVYERGLYWIGVPSILNTSDKSASDLGPSGFVKAGISCVAGNIDFLSFNPGIFNGSDFGDPINPLVPIGNAYRKLYYEFPVEVAVGEEPIPPSTIAYEDLNWTLGYHPYLQLKVTGLGI